VFSEWFSANPMSAVFWIMALPATVILLIQTIMLLFGLGTEGDFGADSPDLDTDADGVGDLSGGGNDAHDINDFDAGLRLFTVRGMVAFFAVGGWSGLSALSLGASAAVSAVAAFVMGVLALVFVALLFKWAMKLQQNGTMDHGNAVGKQGEVYITIGANRSSAGKISIIVQSQLSELSAVTDSPVPLKYGERVTVTEVLPDNTLVVMPSSFSENNPKWSREESAETEEDKTPAKQ
jgi:membrane protein implicated in regulation of membrane protease activity